MKKRLSLQWAALAASALLIGGCATQGKGKGYDYTAFRESRPKSILVLPPLNSSPDINATYSMLAQTTAPLAESGYYVFPVTLVDETFKQNGLTNAADIHGVDAKKLNEIFGADAGLYVTISKYGTTYAVIDSVTVVSVDAKLVDLKTGALLWQGAASASSNEGNNNGGGLVGMLITAAVKQVINSSTDAAHPIAGITSARLLSAGQRTGILYGPRNPKYGTD